MEITITIADGPHLAALDEKLKEIDGQTVQDPETKEIRIPRAYPRGLADFLRGVVSANLAGQFDVFSIEAPDTAADKKEIQRLAERLKAAEKSMAEVSVK